MVDQLRAAYAGEIGSASRALGSRMDSWDSADRWFRAIAAASHSAAGIAVGVGCPRAVAFVVELLVVA